MRACRPLAWSDSGTGARIDVRCTSSTGALADSKFIVTYATSIPQE